jgi:hypothetical protein
MVNRILVLLPSMGRPDAYTKCIDSWRSTTSGASKILGIVPTGATYPRHDDVMVMVDPFTDGVVKAINRAFMAYPDYAAYMFAADDMRFKTTYWDTTFLSTLQSKDGVGVVYGDDTIEGQRLPTHWCVGGRLARAVGYLGLPTCRHICSDVFWMDLATRMSCLTYKPEVVTEHLHFHVGRSKYDSTYDHNNNATDYTQDSESYVDFATHMLPHEVKRVLRSLNRTKF